MLSICAIFRDESLYLEEWLEFHTLVGVQKFYLYQNNSVDNYASVLRRFIKDGRVTLIIWPFRTQMQMSAYKHFANSFAPFLSGWVAFIDIDEFLFSPKYDQVEDALNTFPTKWGGVAVNWRMFGTSGLKRYDHRPVVERFTKKCPDNHIFSKYVKSVLRTGRRWSMEQPHNLSPNGGLFDELGRRIPSSFTQSHTSKILALNHYSSKSEEEYEIRLAKGTVDTGSPRASCLPELEQATIEDVEIQRFLPKLKSLCVHESDHALLHS